MFLACLLDDIHNVFISYMFVPNQIKNISLRKYTIQKVPFYETEIKWN